MKFSTGVLHIKKPRNHPVYAVLFPVQVPVHCQKEPGKHRRRLFSCPAHETRKTHAHASCPFSSGFHVLSPAACGLRTINLEIPCPACTPWMPDSVESVQNLYHKCLLGTQNRPVYAGSARPGSPSLCGKTPAARVPPKVSGSQSPSLCGKTPTATVTPKVSETQSPSLCGPPDTHHPAPDPPHPGAPQKKKAGDHTLIRHPHKAFDGPEQHG